MFQHSSLAARRRAVPGHVDTTDHNLFYPKKTIARQRPNSGGTFIDDTDSEHGDWDEPHRQSIQSLSYGTNTTLSSPEIPTPDLVPRNQPTYRTGKEQITGPTGPNLFGDTRASRDWSRASRDWAENVEVYIEPSSLPDFEPSPSPYFEPSPSPYYEPPVQAFSNPYLLSPKTPQASRIRYPDVSNVSEEEIKNWNPSNVAHWLYISGYPDEIRDRFIENDITGSILMSLTKEDLKEQLEIKSLGKRHEIIGSIEYLMKHMQPGPIPEPTPSQFQSEAEFSGDEVLSSYAEEQSGTQATTAESVSIVGIEEFLPRHKCRKGEQCSKFQRLKEKHLKKIATEYPGADFQEGPGAIFIGSPGNPETARNLMRPTSEAELSVMASSNIFGPRSGPRLSEAALSEVGRLDPRETIRNFLRHQHVDEFPKPKPLGLDTYNLPPADKFEDISPFNAHNSMATNLRNLPKLTIPTSPNTEDMTTAVTTNRYFTPTHQNGSPTAVQQFGPFSQAHKAQAIEAYRQDTPFSEVDVPITAIPSDPICRDVSQSVPPSMQYGTLFPPYRDSNSLARSNSIHSRDVLPLRDDNYLKQNTLGRSRDAFPLRQVDENRPLTPIDVPEDLIRTPRMNQRGFGAAGSALASDPDVTHAGYMKTRKTTRLLKREWAEAHFTLRGTNLAMHKDERDAHRISRALDNIEVNNYAVACSSQASSSKLTAKFKRSLLGGNNSTSSGDGTAFAFSLVPATKESPKKALFGNNPIKTHHFAVGTREQRIDWMRELMLAKALNKGKEHSDGVSHNGNMI